MSALIVSKLLDYKKMMFKYWFCISAVLFTFTCAFASTHPNLTEISTGNVTLTNRFTNFGSYRGTPHYAIINPGCKYGYELVREKCRRIVFFTVRKSRLNSICENGYKSDGTKC